MRDRTIAHLFGVPVSVHPSLAVMCLFVTAVASITERYVNPHWGNTTSLAFGLIGALIYCASIFLHEGSHFVALRSHRIPVESLTFNALGGRIRGPGQIPNPKADLIVSASGPVCTLLLVGLGFGAFALLAGTDKILATDIALALAVLNLIILPGCIVPVWPADSSRALRAILWQASGNVFAATRIVCRLSFIVIGLFLAAGAVLLANPALPGSRALGTYGLLAGATFLFQSRAIVVTLRGSAEPSSLGALAGQSRLPAAVRG